MITNAAAVAESLVPLIQAFRENPHGELEGSLGVIGKDDSFTAGVAFPYFKSLLGTLATNTAWTDTVDNSHFASYIFPDNIRGRYTVVAPATFVKKTTQYKMNVKCSTRAYDFRVSLRTETPVENHVAVKRPIHTRLHTRWSFEHKKAWRYDLSRVGQGKNKRKACDAPRLYEIELELLKSSELLSNASNLVLAYHIVEKMSDLLGRYNSVTNTKLPLTLIVQPNNNKRKSLTEATSAPKRQKSSAEATSPQKTTEIFSSSTE